MYLSSPQVIAVCSYIHSYTYKHLTSALLLLVACLLELRPVGWLVLMLACLLWLTGHTAASTRMLNLTRLQDLWNPTSPSQA